jgi:hypothetical protein
MLGYLFDKFKYFYENSINVKFTLEEIFVLWLFNINPGAPLVELAS